MSQCNINIIPKDQIDNESIRLTTSIPPVRNQSILVKPVINVSTTPHSSQHFLTMKILMLRFKLVSLEIKMCDKMMAVISFLKNESPSLKKESSDKAKNASHNSNNSKATNAPQYNNELD